MIENYENWLKCFSASCRVMAKGAIGSATIIYSKEGHTYALTNFHVVENNVEYKDEWNHLLQKDVKTEYTSTVEILFPRMNVDRVKSYNTVVADIVLYDKQQDIALLKFRDDLKYEPIELYSKEKAREVAIGSDLCCIGAALGEQPISTFGHFNGAQKEIDNYEYWLSTANSIFGNSGGGIFISEDDKWSFLGIPSRIAVTPIGFSSEAITHMGYFIPLFRIYDLFEENCFYFLYDDSFTAEQCEQLREEKREKELLKMFAKLG